MKKNIKNIIKVTKAIIEIVGETALESLITKDFTDDSSMRNNIYSADMPEILSLI